MTILFNRFAALGPKTGVGHYTAEVYSGLVRLAADEIEPFPRGLTWGLGKLWGATRPALSRAEKQRDVAHLRTSGSLRLKTRLLHSLRAAGQNFLAKRFRALAARGNFALYHEPNFIPFPCDLPTVSTVHDLSVLLHPEWHPAGRVLYYEKHLPDVLRQVSRFISVSEFTRREMVRHLGISTNRITTVYNGKRPGLYPLGAREIAAKLHTHDLEPGFLLHVGTIEPRKNLLMLLRMYCDLDAALRARAPLVLVGNWGWNSEEIREFYHSEARHRGARHIGYLDDDELPAFYNGARALVFPSFYEGFGLPPLEMAACGGAILASTAEAVVEIVGRCAEFLHPADDSGWREAMRRILVDDDWRDELRKRTTGLADSFSWQRCAAETLGVYGIASESLRAA